MLEARGVTRRFGATLANDRVDVRAAPGEVVALVGENGAGKSTLLRLLSGGLRPHGGAVWVDGQPAALDSPREAAARGVTVVHQHFALVPSLTVAENLWLALGGGRGPALERARRVLSDTGLDVPLGEPVGSLPVPLQQRAEMLRALAQEGRYLLLDEPTATLGPADTAAVHRLVRRLAAEGRGVVVVTHKIPDVVACADRVVVLRRGRVVAEWPVDAADPEGIGRAMVGELPAPPPGRRPTPAGAPEALALRDVSCPGERGSAGLKGVSLHLRAGEILGLAGVSGNGQELVAEVAAGLRRPSSGRVLLGGRDVTGLSPAARQRLGLGHVPADRRRHGSVPGLSVGWNLCLRRYAARHLSPFGWIRRGRWRAFSEELVNTVSGGWALAASAGSLSGGNLQRLILARELEAGADVLVAVYPTRGLDGAATAQIRNLLAAGREAGRAVLLVSEDLDELLELSDRLVVMSGGRVAGEFSGGEATAEAVGLCLGAAVGAA